MALPSGMRDALAARAACDGDAAIQGTLSRIRRLHVEAKATEASRARRTRGLSVVGRTAAGAAADGFQSDDEDVDSDSGGESEGEGESRTRSPSPAGLTALFEMDL